MEGDSMMMKYIAWCDETGYVFADDFQTAVTESGNLIKDAMQNGSFDSVECTIYEAINLVGGKVSVDIKLDVYPEEKDADDDTKDKENKSVVEVAPVRHVIQN
jgi:hypothetical protein